MSRSNSVIIKGRIAIDLVVLPLCAIDINSKIKQIFYYTINIISIYIHHTS